MTKTYFLFICFLVVTILSCTSESTNRPSPASPKIQTEELQVHQINDFVNSFERDSDFINVGVLVPQIIQEIRYADTNNFTGMKIYDCPACFLQREVASALELAYHLAAVEGYKLKVFDCYRAYDYQVKLYEAFPNFNYVAKPWKGSMHSLGCAVDLTLCDEKGIELEMGTSFDSFDKKSYTYSQAIDSVAKFNRMQLIGIMNQAGFREIKTEWWHFYYPKCNKKVNNNLKWTCP